MRKLFISAALLLVAGSCLAQSVNLLTTADSRSLQVIASTTEAKDGVRVLAHAPSATSIAMRGDGAALATCPLTAEIKSCLFTWTKASMIQRKCVNCELLVTATEATGKTYRVKTEVIRP